MTVQNAGGALAVTLSPQWGGGDFVLMIIQSKGSDAELMNLGSDGLSKPSLRS